MLWLESLDSKSSRSFNLASSKFPSPPLLMNHKLNCSTRSIKKQLFRAIFFEVRITRSNKDSLLISNLLGANKLTLLPICFRVINSYLWWLSLADLDGRFHEMSAMIIGLTNKFSLLQEKIASKRLMLQTIKKKINYFSLAGRRTHCHVILEGFKSIQSLGIESELYATV